MPTPADLQRDIAHLTDMAKSDLATILQKVTTAAEAQQALFDLLPALVDQYGSAAAFLAADWYDTVRESLGVAGRFSAIPGDIADSGVEALIGWATDTAASDDTFQELLAGGMQRRIANFARTTITGSAHADPRADGWQRVARVNGCRFCQMLAGRGAVYSEKTVRFGAHDDCNCQAAPKFADRGDLFDVDGYKRSVRRASQSDETRAADNARAKAWIADNL